jgi:hypothetical protein
MNDPHVETLFYHIRHGARVDYARTQSLELDEPRFGIKIENRLLEVTMKFHHATVEGARDEVEPFLRVWELSAALNLRPGELEFAYARSTVIDRNPTPAPATHEVSATFVMNVETFFDAVVSRSKYPDPPSGIARDADVDLMLYCYCQHYSRERTLGDAANFCLTVLEAHSGRSGAASRYKISKPVLSELGKLAANKGGTEARKAKGAAADFTPAEKRWLEETMKRLIRRAAEVAHDPSATRPQITMVDLPSL